MRTVQGHISTCLVHVREQERCEMCSSRSLWLFFIIIIIVAITSHHQGQLLYFIGTKWDGAYVCLHYSAVIVWEILKLITFCAKAGPISAPEEVSRFGDLSVLCWATPFLCFCRELLEVLFAVLDFCCNRDPTFFTQLAWKTSPMELTKATTLYLRFLAAGEGSTSNIIQQDWLEPTADQMLALRARIIWS